MTKKARVPIPPVEMTRIDGLTIPLVGWHDPQGTFEHGGQTWNISVTGGVGGIRIERPGDDGCWTVSISDVVEAMLKTIGGKPGTTTAKAADAGERARVGLREVREFVEDQLAASRALDLTEGNHLTAALNAVADRLQTCDAVEAKLERQTKAHATLIAAATAALQEMKTQRACLRKAKITGFVHDVFERDLEDALTGVKK